MGSWNAGRAMPIVLYVLRPAPDARTVLPCPAWPHPLFPGGLEATTVLTVLFQQPSLVHCYHPPIRLITPRWRCRWRRSCTCYCCQYHDKPHEPSLQLDEEGTYLFTTLSMPSQPIRRTSHLGPYEKRTKWWHELSNRSRRIDGLRSKKIPGTTMTFSSRQAEKKLRPSAMGSGRPSRFSQLHGESVSRRRRDDDGSLKREKNDNKNNKTRGHAQVKGGIRHEFDHEAHVTESLHDVVALFLQGGSA